MIKQMVYVYVFGCLWCKLVNTIQPSIGYTENSIFGLNFFLSFLGKIWLESYRLEIGTKTLQKKKKKPICYLCLTFPKIFIGRS